MVFCYFFQESVKFFDFFSKVACIWSKYTYIMHCSQSRGVTVAQVILVHFVEVRILTGLPFFCLDSGCVHQKCARAGIFLSFLRSAAVVLPV